MTSKSGNQVQQHTATTNPLSSGILQRQCATCGQHTIAGGECEECHKNHSEPPRHSNSQPVPPPEQNLPTVAGAGFNHDFTQIPVRRMEQPLIQAKLRVGSAGDKYEQEADRVATQVIRMPQQLKSLPGHPSDTDAAAT